MRWKFTITYLNIFKMNERVILLVTEPYIYDLGDAYKSVVDVAVRLMGEAEMLKKIEMVPVNRKEG